METVVIAALPPKETATASPVAYADVLAHPEQYYDKADIVWVMMSSALVFIMIPSLSLIYSGMGNRSFALTLFRLPMVTAAFVGLQWALWGYAVTFTDSALPSNWWGGESRGGGLKDVLGRPISTGDGAEGPAIPELVFVVYEGMFASFTAALVCGGTMHRVRPRRFIIFITLWSLLIYDPVARWSWSRRGWSKLLGTMDFAGGTPVHVVSGTTVAAFAVFCSIESKASLSKFASDSGKRVWSRIRHMFHGLWSVLRIVILICSCGSITPREGVLIEETPPAVGQHSYPYNVNYLVLGTALLWFGWAGFNGGSALGGNLRAVSAWASTHVAACAGGVTGMFWVWFMKAFPDEEDPQSAGQPDEAARNRALARQAFDRLSICFFCDGAISGLVTITPAAGYVPIWSAAIFGIVGALAVNFLKKETELFLRHDPLQVFAVHAGGGAVGMILTALFADPVTIGLDGHSTIPHPEYPKRVRLGYQLLDVTAGMGYTFFMTLGILYLMKLVVYMSLCGSTKWRHIAVYDELNRLEDEFQATIQQQWQGDLDPEGRPLPRFPTPIEDRPQQQNPMDIGLQNLIP
ncbi:ammonium transporter AmtB-like domain-containing protein [Podospora didyma]|uniref:Ammonium transporter AmtB-like domain-containing protein n=1 Tax=Podospora didyma TaxID=330526 RepID=A0AAE0P5U9_9PEZI|nr:ammonium transporter AmtB-like domain-containing protein [Podospora didyma]